MSKTVEQWLLFKYVGLEFTPLSKPFKTREQTEKAREKYPERLCKMIGLGVIRIKKQPVRLGGRSGEICSNGSVQKPASNLVSIRLQ